MSEKLQGVERVLYGIVSHIDDVVILVMKSFSHGLTYGFCFLLEKSRPPT